MKIILVLFSILFSDKFALGEKLGNEMFPEQITITHFPEFRRIDGSQNHIQNPEWGNANIPLLRKSDPQYQNGYDSPSGQERPNPRFISNYIHTQKINTPNNKKVSDYLWVWGQFIDHDVGLTEVHHDAESMNIIVPENDVYFIPSFETPTVEIVMSRSNYKVDDFGIRQQMNGITSYIDASNVYGSNLEREQAIRLNDGSGKLKTSEGNFLPFNIVGLPNAPSSEIQDLFLAGDVRANEQLGLVAMHTLFVREHNSIAEMLKRENPYFSGEQIYQLARSIVISTIQKITYNEFLPLLIGELPEYRGYDQEINPSLNNEFSTFAFRVGHTMLSSALQLVNSEQQRVGSLALRDVFFRPQLIVQPQMMENLLRGLSTQVAQNIDVLIVDDVRNFLFGRPGAGGFDLASLNIQRGRDHGIGGYNEIRHAYGLLEKDDFSEITSNDSLANRLTFVFGSPSNMDPWTAGLAEDHLPGSLVGETLSTIIKDQFIRLRDGDRFWYERILNRRWLKWVNNQSLKSVIVRNTGITDDDLPNSVFKVEEIRNNKKLISKYGVLCLMQNGKVECLDVGDRGIRFSRKIVNAKDIAVTSSAACVLDDNGVVCGTSGAPSPVMYHIPNDISISRIWGGENSVCMEGNSGVQCWGEVKGQLLNERQLKFLHVSRTPQKYFFTGLNDDGVFMNSQNHDGSFTQKNTLEAWNRATEFDLSDYSQCAVVRGKVSCISSGSMDIVKSVENIKDAKNIALDDRYGCVIDGSKLKCWNNYRTNLTAIDLGVVLSSKEDIAVKVNEVCYTLDERYNCISLSGL